MALPDSLKHPQRGWCGSTWRHSATQLQRILYGQAGTLDVPHHSVSSLTVPLPLRPCVLARRP